MRERRLQLRKLDHNRASLLLYGDADDCVLDFETAGVACLKRFDDDRWAAEWMVVPELIVS